MNVKDKLKQLLSPGSSLTQRAVRGSIWIFALRITTRLFTLARMIVLARVLAPNDFGLMGIALLAMSTLEIFSQTGFDTALIQKKGDTDAYLDTCWTVQVIRGILLFGILFAAAPLVAAFFDTPKAAAIVRVIAVAELLKGFTNIGVIYFQKEIEFNKQFLYQFSSTLAHLAVAIPAALILRSVWALVFGLLAGQFVGLIMSYVIHPYKPRVKIDWGKGRELFNFGRWILGSSILAFLLTQGDDIFLGKVLGVTALGFYQMAYRLSNLPATEITHVISQVSFPVYSKVQDNIEKLRKAYLEVLQLTTFISIPLAVGIFVLAPDFTRLFLGEKWMPMVSAMKVLAFWGMLRSITASTGPLFYSIGRPDIVAKLQFVKLLLLAALIYPLTNQWRIVGTSLAVGGSALLLTPFYLYFSGKIVECSGFAFFRVFNVPAIGAIVMLFGMNFEKAWFSSERQFIGFFAVLTTGLCLYATTMLILDRVTGYNVFKIIRKRVVGH